jgi:predicted transcriptional regulator of viral defense system
VDSVEVLERIAGQQGGVVTAAQARSAGLATYQVARLCRSGRWHRLTRGVYAIAGTVASVEATRRAEIGAAVASLGSGACAVLDTAAELHGIGGLRRTDTIHVSVPPDAPRAQRISDRSLAVHQLVVAVTELTDVAGILVTTPQRTVADLLLRAPRFEAVSVVDSALNNQLMGEEELAALPALLKGRRGSVRARSRLAEADGRARSPLETRVRLRCVDGGVAPDEVGYLIRDAEGYVIAEADLAWLAARVVAEADGAGPHGLPDAVFTDRRRQNTSANAGWLVLRFTWADTLRPDYIPLVVSEALRSRLPLS